MKTYLALVFVFAIVQAGSEESKESSSTEDLKELSTLLKDKFNVTIVDDIMKLMKKVEEECPDIESKIETAVEKVAECIEGVELGSDTFCQLVRKNYHKCSKPVREIIISCLPKESKGLPILAEKIMTSVIDQVCNSTVEEILELFNPCTMKEGIDESNPQCDDVEKALVQHKNKLPSNSLICEIMPKLKSCAKTTVEESCKNPITRHAHIQFYEAVEYATKDECDELNKA